MNYFWNNEKATLIFLIGVVILIIMGSNSCSLFPEKSNELNPMPIENKVSYVRYI